MRKFRKSDKTCRTLLRLREVKQVTEVDLWSGLDSEEVNRIVEVLDDTPDELYEALKAARSSGFIRKKFQRMAVRTEPEENRSNSGCSQYELELLRSKILQKKE